MRRAVALALWALDLAALAGLALVPLLWLRTDLALPLADPPVVLRWRPWLFFLPFAALLLRALLARRLRRGGALPAAPGNRAGFQNLCLALGSVFAFLVAVEQGLELAGYERTFPPLVVAEDVDAEPTAEDRRVFLPDPVLRWRFNPGVEWNGRRINRLGFSDREVDPAKAPGTARVICFGDSTTGQGGYPYSRVLNDLLAAGPPTDRPWEAFNMGVHGYSVYQGLLLYKTRGAALEPDVVTILFGWNDHWRSLDGRTDSEISARPVRPWAAPLLELLRGKRFGQLLIATLGRPEVAREGGDGAPARHRVPIGEYRQLLAAFVGEVRRNGSVPVLLTAPRADRIWVPASVAGDLDEAVRTHDEYLEVVREVARETGAHLVDLERALGRDPRWFSRDGFHFRQAGIERVAERIHEGLRELVRTEQWRRRG